MRTGSQKCAECGLGGHESFVERVTNWINESKIIREVLSYEGQSLITQITRRIPLRELARRTGFSPTYLSQVANGHVVISPGAFVKIATMEW
jgi:transcriptional regulator with XRE-family HTH domain